MINSIYFLPVPQLLNDSRTQQKPPSEPTFPAATNYNNEQHDPYRHSFAATTNYYQSQQEPYRQLLLNKELQFLISILFVY